MFSQFISLESKYRTLIYLLFLVILFQPKQKDRRVYIRQELVQ